MSKGLPTLGAVNVPLPVSVANGGTASATAPDALTALGAAPAAGSSSIVTVGTITSGVWSGTALVAAKVPALNAITAPAADVSMNTHKITNLVDGVSAQDAVTKSQLDAVTGYLGRTEINAVAALSIPAWNGSNPAIVAFANEIIDSLGIWTVADPTKITIATDGVYELEAWADILNEAAEYVSMGFVKNSTTWGAAVLVSDSIRAYASNFTQIRTRVPAIELVATDIIRLLLVAQAGVHLNGNGTTDINSRVWVRRLA